MLFADQSYTIQPYYGKKVLVCAFTIIVAEIKGEYLKTFTIKTFNTALEFRKRLRAVYIDAEISLNKSDT